jgi:hypothetical protein
VDDSPTSQSASLPPVPSPDEKQPAAYPPDPGEAKAPELPTGVDSGSTRALSSLLKASPFLDLHEKAGGKHPLRGGICFISDYLVRLTVLVLILGIIGCVAWKTLAPLPAFWQRP